MEEEEAEAQSPGFGEGDRGLARELDVGDAENRPRTPGGGGTPKNGPSPGGGGTRGEEGRAVEGDLDGGERTSAQDDGGIGGTGDFSAGGKGDGGLEGQAAGPADSATGHVPLGGGRPRRHRTRKRGRPGRPQRR